LKEYWSKKNQGRKDQYTPLTNLPVSKDLLVI